MPALLVMTNVPTREVAQTIARELLECRLAACVNVLDGCDSIYRWQGNIEQVREIPLLIKTCADRYAEVEAAIRAKHPYELPEIIAVRVERGMPAYLQWLADETS